MKRDLAQLSNRIFDVVVVGGGIYGACIAWDAALRGLSVALIERGDFGHATSSNSLKVIHGGLRYLQDGSLPLMRRMIRERTTWMRIAPHLVHPLPCLVPTYRKLTRSKLALSIGVAINDLVGYDRNRSIDPQKRLPNGQILSRAECLGMLPGIKTDGITGGAIWYDAQIHNSERLLLSFVLSASRLGAVAANYVEAAGLLQDERRVLGVKARDVLTGQEFELQARMVVNCAGAWVDAILSGLDSRPAQPRFHLSTAMNLVTRQILSGYAAGFSSQYRVGRPGEQDERSRILFMVPWRKRSIIGTIHSVYTGTPENFQVSEAAIQEFIDEINRAFPGAELKREDVYNVHSGFLPMVPDGGRAGGVRLVRESRIHDHEREDKIAGLVTVVGVKYTTARSTAQQAVDLVVKKLGRESAACQTLGTPVYGGQIDDFCEFLAHALEKRPYGLSPETIEHLVYTYGSEYPRVLKYLDDEPGSDQTISNGSPVIKAEILHAVREEMAQKLDDVIQRRTELATAGPFDESGLETCAEIVAAELGWDQAKKEQALQEARAARSIRPMGIQETIGMR